MDLKPGGGLPAEDPAKGFVFTRGKESVPHHRRKPRGAQDPGFAMHPVVERGLRLFAESSSGGASARTLFSAPSLHVSYAWFKSGYPLPLHSHDVDCYYLVIAGSMRVGSEELEKGDGVLIPGGTPYTVNPGEHGVEIIEMRTSPDYDTDFRAKTDSYWQRAAATQRARTELWKKEPAPYGLVSLAAANET